MQLSILVRYSNIGPILPCVRGIADFLLRNRPPHLFHPKFGVLQLDQITNVWVSPSQSILFLQYSYLNIP